MPGISLQNDSRSFVNSQTRNLPLETWQEIFWLASRIEGTDEFMTNAGSYDRTLWDGGNVVKAEMTPWELRVALQTRRNITHVCKAWYAMGIEILYSHIRIIASLWGDPASKRLVDNPQLLSHTKRLTIISFGFVHIPLAANLAWTARLCASLPRLRILDVPGDILLSLPNQSLSSSLTAAIFRGCRETCFDTAVAPLPIYPSHTPWRNIRVLKIELHSLDLRNERLERHLGEMNFASVEELYFTEGRDEGIPISVLKSISSQSRFPKLHTLSICDFEWLYWWGFLEAHSQKLKILSLTTDGCSSSPEDKEKIDFPALEYFHLDYYDINHTIVARKVTRVGWHGVGCDGDPDRETTEYDKSESLRYLLLTFDYWLHFPAATTYCITGWHKVLEWLEEQPEVMQRVTSCKTRGVDVKFIHMDKKRGGSTIS